MSKPRIRSAAPSGTWVRTKVPTPSARTAVVKNGQRRVTSGRRYPPERPCQALVRKAGHNTSTIAFSTPTKTVINPRPMAGNPKPTSPLTNPAMTNAMQAMASKNGSNPRISVKPAFRFSTLCHVVRARVFKYRSMCP